MEREPFHSLYSGGDPNWGSPLHNSRRTVTGLVPFGERDRPGYLQFNGDRRFFVMRDRPINALHVCSELEHAFRRGVCFRAVAARGQHNLVGDQSGIVEKADQVLLGRVVGDHVAGNGQVARIRQRRQVLAEVARLKVRDIGKVILHPAHGERLCFAQFRVRNRGRIGAVLQDRTTPCERLAARIGAHNCSFFTTSVKFAQRYK